MNAHRKKVAIIVASSATVLAVSGVAFAYWTAAGSGSGSATTGTTATLTITQTSTVTDMGPGVAAQTLSGTFTASKPTYVGQVTPTVLSTNRSGTDEPGCGAGDFTIVLPTVTNAEVVTGATWGGGSIAFNNKAAVNQNACKGVTVVIGYTSN